MLKPALPRRPTPGGRRCCCRKADLLPGAVPESCCAFWVLHLPAAARAGCRPRAGQNLRQRSVMDAANAQCMPILNNMACNKTPSTGQTLRARGPRARLCVRALARHGSGPAGSGSGRAAMDFARGRPRLIIGPTAPRQRDDSTFPVGRRASRQRLRCWAHAGRRMSYNLAVTVLVRASFKKASWSLSSQESPSSSGFQGLAGRGMSRIKGMVHSILQGSFYPHRVLFFS